MPVARSRSTSKSKGGGRGSPEAIAKRRAARHLNSLFGEGGRSAGALDGRTEKRRRRLLAELKDGRNGRPLKAIEILTHTNELLELGETLSSIRKAGAKPLKSSITDSDRDVIMSTQTEYGFRPEAWKMLGVDISGGESAGKRGRKKKAS
jgi:hypothetical protein